MLSETLGLTDDSEEAAQLANTAGVNTSSDIITNPEQPSQDVTDLKSVFAKATLLLVQWQQETRSVSTQDLLDNLMRIQRVYTIDKVAFAIGQLYDTIN
ncbi:hypothetical protein FBU59_000216 [Linderina macrospora]|uniref:Uncharacterized protein n=1 Tax=Linderina macrospora TaxID=4868 RepID=A0ACC1JHU9_9FUNG|nr:hypothetical protein FBU59_000216 [Linderina macrospora]